VTQDHELGKLKKKKNFKQLFIVAVPFLFWFGFLFAHNYVQGGENTSKNNHI